MLVFFLWTLAGFSQRKNPSLILAVLDFENHSIFGAEELHSLRPGLADMMITAPSQVSGLKVVERRQLCALLVEMALGQSGVVDTAAA